jgi:ubiquinone/menaquinone biosynthesis C-methylase UbiE/glycosyltransferase involved in cell wall biosynthesis
MNIDAKHESQLPWTGERYVPQVTGEIQLEHVHRYLLAREYAKDKDVLDIACGEGFGSAILANTAQSVVGVDIAAEAVRHAAIRYQRENIQFRQGSCAEIPLNNNSIDLVVSFETIEHHDEHKAMMAEIKRVLRPGGVLIISSPDKKEYSILPNYRNPFHVRELFKEEFEDLIRAYFKNLALLCQRIVYGSGILPEAGAFPVIDYDIKDRSRSHRGLARPRYLIAVASDEALPVLSGGLLEQTVEESEIVKSRSGVITLLEDKVRQLEEQLHSQASLSADKVRQLEEQLHSQASQSSDKIRQLEEQLHSQASLSADKVRQLEEQLHSQASQSSDKIRQLEEQLHSQASQSSDKIRQLEEQLHSQASQSSDKVRQLEEQVVHANLALDEARRLCRSMSSSLSWILTRPLRVLRDAVAATVKKVKRRDSPPPESTDGPSNTGRKTDPGSPLESVAGSSNARLETDPGAELLLTIFDESHYLKQVPSAAESGITPLEHYRTIGWRKGHNPHALFDVGWYLSENRDVDEAGAEPLLHYLEQGWKEGRNPHPLFDVKRYLAENTDVAQAGIEPLCHYCEYGRKDGRYIHPAPFVDKESYLKSYLDVAKAGLDPHGADLAALLRSSGFFDGDAYDAAANARAQGFDPALHYVFLGEEQGFKPSPAFDPVYYGERYPDIAAWGGNRLGHYLETGRAEGRRALPIADTLMLPVAEIEPDRPTVLMLIHEASRTGAPILGWNIARALRGKVNVVAIIMREGPLKNAFAEVAAAVVCCGESEIFGAVEASRLARRLVEMYRPLYVIANSVETRGLVPGFTDRGVPVIALVHEFSGYTKPAASLQQLYERATEVVFPAEIVRRSSEIDYAFLRLRHTRILPQGPSEVPSSRVPSGDPQQTETKRSIRSRLRPQGAWDDLVVVGMGFVDWRKGVDLFIATATAILARDPDAAVRFIWIGHGYRVADSVDVSCYLSEQVRRSSLGDRFDLMDAVEDIESIYKEADVLFLSSRLDPLPNVSIDAALRGIPVVCFAEASGMAEILTSNEETRELVVPHMDVGAAATLIGSLAADGDKLRRLGHAVRELARARFDMGAYVIALDELGRRATQTAKQEDADAATILAAGAFDSPLYLGTRAPFVELAAAVREYSAVAGKIDYERVPVSGAYTRRPLAGFNPFSYALRCPNYDRRARRDPLAHYLKAGRPDGPWVHQVFRIEAPENSARPLPMPVPTAPRVLLHGHFHYTDHLGDFVRALAANAQPCELIVTTTSIDKAATIRATLQESWAKADIRVVPNRGRDIAPFLTVLEEAIGSCDLLGHVHGKRSLSTGNVDVDFGDRWRTFLWQHLVGDEMPMVDVIKQAFAEDLKLGLIFPEDPFLIGWEENLQIAQELAARMELATPLPAIIEFPVGTMFWARPEALAPLLRLGLTSNDYPPEPLPIDGTVLHALERLLPRVAEEAGYHYATTYLPRFVR